MWKLAYGSRSDLAFPTLSVKITKDVVSLDLSVEEHQKMLAAGPSAHLSALEFHRVIENEIENNHSGDRSNIVLLDVRNSYEIEIGTFTHSHGKAVNPNTRQFGDFKHYVDSNLDALVSADKVLMYCTGGVRCERASALLRAKGVDKVFQLEGGIVSYMDQFPSGGYFKGKNFVYDPRGSVPYAALSRQDDVVGKCRLCSTNYDSYIPQIR